MQFVVWIENSFFIEEFKENMVSSPTGRRICKERIEADEIAFQIKINEVFILKGKRHEDFALIN